MFQKLILFRWNFAATSRRETLYTQRKSAEILFCASGAVDGHNRPRPVPGYGNSRIFLIVLSERIKILYGRTAGKNADTGTSPCSRIHTSMEFPQLQHVLCRFSRRTKSTVVRSLSLPKYVIVVSTKQRTPTYYQRSPFHLRQPSIEHCLWKKILHCMSCHSAPQHLWNSAQLTIPQSQTPSTAVFISSAAVRWCSFRHHQSVYVRGVVEEVLTLAFRHKRIYIKKKVSNNVLA